MNDRINELFGQALDQAVPETWTTLTPAQLSKLKDKFAELIVGECADLVDNLVTSDDEGNQILDCDDIKTELLEHFGVES
jgi:hypothetical protein